MEEPKQSKFYIFIRENAFIIILINIIVIILSPWLFTRYSGILNFTETGQIGDTLGGITAPFLNILNAFLIFLAFQEQKNANQLLKNQIEIEKNRDLVKLKGIKNLILYDLEHRIKPNAKKIIPETRTAIDNLDSEEIQVSLDHIDFNDKVFQSNNLSDYNLIFNQNIEDLKIIINIYGRINFIFKHSALHISYKYPIDKENIVFNNIADQEKAKIIQRNKAKKKIELEALIPNLNFLITKIDEILTKYK